jgi:hypothetical protein
MKSSLFPTRFVLVLIAAAFAGSGCDLARQDELTGLLRRHFERYVTEVGGRYFTCLIRNNAYGGAGIYEVYAPRKSIVQTDVGKMDQLNGVTQRYALEINFNLWRRWQNGTWAEWQMTGEAPLHREIWEHKGERLVCAQEVSSPSLRALTPQEALTLGIR